jgi:anti-sigma regulatory factor (Ser/Thr protein kinase)
MEEITLSIPSVPKLLRTVRCAVAEIADLAGFSEKDCDKICLAVDEACSNVIRHSYKDRPDGKIIIKCSFESGSLSISVRDFGEKFDAKTIQTPDPKEVKPGGLGIHMIRSVMDEVDYDCSHEVGTEIHMTKYARPEEN